MRWIMKTSLDGIVYDDVMCEGAPPIPEDGTTLLLPVDGHYTLGVVAETSIDRKRDPAVLRITCLNPDAFDKT